jgi:hypothetical protein
MSAFPSPLKSATALTRQPSAPLRITALDSMVVPSMSHICVEPSAFCQRRSALPSPLKSPVNSARVSLRPVIFVMKPSFDPA